MSEDVVSHENWHEAWSYLRFLCDIYEQQGEYGQIYLTGSLNSYRSRYLEGDRSSELYHLIMDA